MWYILSCAFDKKFFFATCKSLLQRPSRSRPISSSDIGNEPSIVPVGRSYIEGKQRSSRYRSLCEDAFAVCSGWDVPPHLCYRVTIGHICARVCTYRHTYRHTYSRNTHSHRCVQDRKFRSHSPDLHLRKGSDDLSGNIPWHFRHYSNEQIVLTKLQY